MSSPPMMPPPATAASSSDENGTAAAGGGVSTADRLRTRDYLDALDEVHTRFILNLPDSELRTADRIFFQVEQAWWFYEDFICDRQQQQQQQQQNQEDGEAATTSPPAVASASLPRFGSLKPFAMEMFKYSPLLPDDEREFVRMWNEFGRYKRKIGNYGCILLNDACTHIVLCRLYQSKTYTLPAGKINQGEDGIQAAARETYEETGFDPLCRFGVTAAWASQEEDEQQQPPQTKETKVAWGRLNEKDSLVFCEDGGKGKRRTCYVCYPVPYDFPFEPTVRKEIATVQWYPIDDLPKPSYAVTPFLHGLKAWINRRQRQQQQQQSAAGDRASGKKSRKTPNRERGDHTPGGGGSRAQSKTPSRSEVNTHPAARSNSRGKNAGSSNRSRGRARGGGSRSGSRGRDPGAPASEDDDVVRSGLCNAGDAGGWSEEDMFLANERLIGRRVEYDGNPHAFVERGFQGNDPHRFHVVGGAFLNSDAAAAAGAEDGCPGIGAIASLFASPPPTSKLQPLFRKESNTGADGDEIHLTPFFADDGTTPWGETTTTTTTTVAAAAAKNDAHDPNRPPPPFVSQSQEEGFGVNPGQSLLLKLQRSAAAAAVPTDAGDGTTRAAAANAVQVTENRAAAVVGDDIDDIFLTDRQITLKSQAIKTAAIATAGGGGATTTTAATTTTGAGTDPSSSSKTVRERYDERRAEMRKRYEEDTEYIRRWVEKLPKPPPSEAFGECRLDADAILSNAFLSVGIRTVPGSRQSQ